jgi:zinc transport system ATP-binding protein
MTLEIEKPLLELTDVSFCYQAKTPILNGATLQVFAGDRIGIIGGNGSGKSTISKLILGILTPQKGIIELFGKPAKWYAHFPKLGYIGDPGHNAEELGLPTNLTVKQIADTVKKLEQLSGAKENEEVSMEGLGLEKLKNRLIRNLSTGERKRLMAYLTFLRNPEFIVLDEPLDGLDRSVVEYIKSLISTAIEKRNTTLFYIAHDIVEIDTYTERVFRLEKGVLHPEAQRRFIGRLNNNGKTISFEEKTGQVIGRLVNLMKSDDSNHGFQLQLNPV